MGDGDRGVRGVGGKAEVQWVGIGYKREKGLLGSYWYIILWYPIGILWYPIGILLVSYWYPIGTLLVSYW